jgi:hypothetical protein
VRAATAGEFTALLDTLHTRHLLKVEVLNADDAWVNLSALQGYDWVESVSIDCERIDQPISTASVTLRREAPHRLSLAPLMEASLPNIWSAVYAPLLDVGTPIRISCAVVARGTLDSAATYRPIFQGRIDRVEWASDPLVLSCSDDGAWLMDTQIETTVEYGSAVGVAIETVMQAILDDWPSVLGTVTLDVPVSPGWALHKYKQDRVKVLEALRALASQIGWEVAFSYDASDVFQLTLFETDRAKTTPDKTIGPSQYLDIRALSLELDNIRNVVLVPYYDTTGAPQTESASDAPSISKLGRRYMEIQEAATSNIDSTTEAQALADAVVSDLVQPPVTHEVEMPLFWPAQFGDLYRFTANGVHYDTDQDLAVVGVRHQWKDGVGLTTLACAGKPRGAYREWLRREVTRKTIERPSLTASQTLAPTDASIVFTGGPFVRYRVNGGAWADATSPITVARNAVGGAPKTVDVEAYAVAGRSDSVLIPFVVPAQVTTGTVPTLDSVSASTNTAPDCGVNWLIDVFWNLTGVNDTEYYVRVSCVETATLIWDDLSTADGADTHDTGVVGDSGFTGYPYDRTYEVELVRRSDSVVIDSATTTTLSVNIGAPC